MRLEAAAELPFPRELVFRTYRDRLVELVPFLPNIRGIEVTARREEPPLTHLVNIWRGGGDVPAVARAFLSERMLTWTDYATWDEAEWSCTWRMETHSFKEAVHAAGKNVYQVTPTGTRLLIGGELTIDGKKLPIPRFLAGSVGPTVEKFLVGLIRPNLTEVAKGVERFLSAGAEKRK
jgi:hypothetical protein